MKDTRVVMGMPVTVEIVGSDAAQGAIDGIFSYFDYVDRKFSTYKSTSEIARINNGALRNEKWSEDMKTVFRLCAQTKKRTNGYFNIVTPDGAYDPSGLVKGWSIHNASKILWNGGFRNFYIDAGGDIQSRGKNAKGKEWTVGIRNPFNRKEIVKVVYPRGTGVATSGTYIRGQHIYNPLDLGKPITEITSLTVIDPNIYEADRFATAAFAMGKKGITFIENLPGFEGYVIDANGTATMTSDFEQYTMEYA